MWITVGLVCCLVFGGLPSAHCTCPSQCSCAFYSINEGTKARTVLCNDPEMTLTPVNIPGDTSKLRIEKTAIRRVPGEAFHSLRNLEYLWMPYNSLASVSVITFRGLRRLQELRLDGNDLILFPWEVLADMPQLRLLDLHNNELTSIPAEAARYIKNITYLDLSSNKLMTLPQELISTWANLQAVPYFPNDNSKIILGLQDNPWVCDCSLYEMVHFLNFQSPNIAFIEPRLKCFTPRSLAGVFFSQVELRKCQSPVVHTSVAKVKTILGSTVLLRCGTTGVPIPELSWRRADGNQLNGTVHQEISSDGMSWSILGLPVVSYLDSGEYICKAKNFLGATEAFISLIITDSEGTDDPNANSKGVWNGKVSGMEAAAYNDKLVARYVITTSTSPTLGARPVRVNTEENLGFQNEAQNMVKEQNNNPRNLLSSLPPGQQEPERIVRSVRVIGDTDQSVSLAWKAPQAKNTTIFSVLYAIFGEREMRRISVEPVSTTHISEDTMKSELVIPSAHLMDEGNYTCTAANFIGNTSTIISLKIQAPRMVASSSSFSSSVSEENAYVDVRIAKQTVYGITLEWYAVTENPGETWYTLHFGKYDDSKKEMIYIGPGTNTYSVNDLLPATKYEVCVTLRNQTPRKGQCIVFVTGSDISELEQREKLIHIIIIVCAMVLAVPAGMYACTTETRLNCMEKCAGFCHKNRKGQKNLRAGNKENTFDSLPTGSEEGLCYRDSSEDKRKPRSPEDKEKPDKHKPNHRNSADLY
uniref:Leucine rich repeat, Ig-like and transmembrane domains 1 n=1 Tax=Chrysemys picta bellii TaxID=8478 RepID=A0A8C3H931_CHRPI